MHLKQRNEEKRSGSFSVIAIAVAVLAFSGCGVTQTASESIGTKGGVISLESGLVLEVPAGALRQETQITVREQRGQGVIAVELEPTGLELATPAKLAWGDDSGSMECEGESGALLQVERNGNLAQTRITRLERLRIRNRERHCDGGGSCGQCADGGCGGGGGGGRCDEQAGEGGQVGSGGSGSGGAGKGGSGGSGACACDGGSGGSGAGGGDSVGKGSGKHNGSGDGDCTGGGDGTGGGRGDGGSGGGVG